MGFTYLNGNNWLSTTREERLFCAHLYWDIKGKEQDFIRWLNETKGFGLAVNEEWEVGFEVCFYRDILKSRNERANPREYSRKRTFDICLFSENAIVIIEAKVQQMFDEAQILSFKNDKQDVKNVTKKHDINVFIIALASLEYFTNYKKYGRNNILVHFDECITWEEMNDLYDNKLYLQASQHYKN